MRSTLLLALGLATSACFGRGGAGLLNAIAGTALLTAVVASASQPPPPRVVFIPEPRPGYAWQPGFWSLQNQQWVWIDGQWILAQPAAAWSPAHWQPAPDGQNWQFVPGQWVAASPQ